MTDEDINKIAVAVTKALGTTVFAQKEVLTMDEAAQYTGLKKGTLYNLTHNRQIPFSKPGGKLCFFKRVDLENWMMSNPVDTADNGLNDRDGRTA